MSSRRMRSITCRTVLLAAVVSLVLSSAAIAAPIEPQLQIDPADQSWAQSIVPTSTDFGSTWEALPGDIAGDPRDNTICPAPLGPDESDLTITGGSSSDFIREDGGAVVFSAVTVWQTPEHAQADWDRTVQPALLSCVSAALSSSSTKKIKLVVTGKRSLTYPALGQRTAAYRFSIAYRMTKKVKKKRKTISLPATFDLVILGSGRATAVLGMLSFNQVPLSEGSKQTLASTVATRMARDPKPKA
ncbi:MAG TPA: hypothetical protein VF891_02770 [Gaiellaceae bacterium]